MQPHALVACGRRVRAPRAARPAGEGGRRAPPRAAAPAAGGGPHGRPSPAGGAGGGWPPRGRPAPRGRGRKCRLLPERAGGRDRQAGAGGFRPRAAVWRCGRWLAK